MKCFLQSSSDENTSSDEEDISDREVDDLWNDLTVDEHNYIRNQESDTESDKDYVPSTSSSSSDSD